MNTTAENLTRLALLCRGDKKSFAAVRETARKLHLPPQQRQQGQPNAAAVRLQNYLRKINRQDLKNAIAKFGLAAVYNQINCAAILEVAAKKFAEQVVQRAGRKS